MASAVDEVLSAAEFVEVDLCCEAIAAAELCACCAGQLPDRLTDNVYGGVQANPHGPHADEIELAVQAVSRVREESELRDLREAVLSGWLKWMVSYRDWDGPASGARPLCLLD